MVALPRGEDISVRCPHCGSLIAEDAHRCDRCGRRLSGASVVFTVDSAAVPALDPVASAPAEPAPRPAHSGAARQVALFDDRPKIIPFETLTGKRVSTRRQPAARREASPAAQPASPARVAQQPLDLRAPAPRQRKAVHDDALVASPSLRLRAALYDVAFCAVGVAIAAATFHFAGGRFLLAGRASLFYSGAVFSLVLFYHLFWCVLGRESAGMRCAGLRVLTFDGHTPTWGQRAGRLILACLGLATAGVGLLWALIDDERLTWHDHVSNTFPTEYDRNPSSFQRR